MKRTPILISLALVAGIVVGCIGTQILADKDELVRGKELQRTALAGAKGREVVLVLRELPPGKESGKHTQSGTEVAYILEGSVIFEMQGKPPVTLRQGDSFQTGPRQIHNVKNASTTAPVKVLVFYMVEKGKALSDFSTPAK
ncbi:MAG: cupin domain-containing protein [candidate division NC10 bacterium]|nr:cupin domain-containing protein [candidate division NC10 bacterium]